MSHDGPNDTELHVAVRVHCTNIALYQGVLQEHEHEEQGQDQGHQHEHDHERDKEHGRERERKHEQEYMVRAVCYGVHLDYIYVLRSLEFSKFGEANPMEIYEIRPLWKTGKYESCGTRPNGRHVSSPLVAQVEEPGFRRSKSVVRATNRPD